MKALFTLFFLLHFETAQAEDPFFHLLGKGVRNAETNDNIALVCVNDACTQATFAKFTADGGFNRIGSVIPIPQLLDPKSFKKAQELILSCYFGQRVKERFRSTEYRLVYWATFIFGGAVIAAFIPPAWPVALQVGTAIAAPTALFGSYSRFVLKARKNKAFSRSKRDSVASFDQNGWNWSDRPEKISSKAYRKLIETIESKPDGSLIEHNKGLMQKISKKLNRLKSEEWMFTNSGGRYDECGITDIVKAQNTPQWKCALNYHTYFDVGFDLVYANEESEARALCQSQLEAGQSIRSIERITANAF